MRRILLVGLTFCVALLFSGEIEREFMRMRMKLRFKEGYDNVDKVLCVFGSPNRVIKFNSRDEWIVLWNSSIAGGDSYDLTLGYDSDGIYWESYYDFSGVEGLKEQVFRSEGWKISDIRKSFSQNLRFSFFGSGKEHPGRSP